MNSFNPYQFQIDQLKQQLEESRVLASDPELGELAAAEIPQLEAQLAEMQKAADEYASGAAGNDNSGSSGEIVNCTLEVRQGTGGDEAKIWGNDLLRMYMRFIEASTLKGTLIDDLVIKIKGRITLEDGTSLTAYDLLRYESGVHRVQRVPETEAAGRVHTSTATVAVIPEVQKKCCRNSGCRFGLAVHACWRRGWPKCQQSELCGPSNPQAYGLNC